MQSPSFSRLQASFFIRRPPFSLTPAAASFARLGRGKPSAENHAARITERFAWWAHGAPVYMPAPGAAKFAAMRREWETVVYAREALDWLDHVAFTIVGIGRIEPSKLLASGGNYGKC